MSVRSMRHLLLLAVLALAVSACGRQTESALPQPEQPPSTAQPAPNTGAQPGAPSVQPPTPGPVHTEPSRPSLEASAVLNILDETGWQFARLREHVGGPEATYQAISGEETNEIEYAFHGGALRVFVSPYGGKVFGLLFDTRLAAYEKAAEWQSSELRVIESRKPYVAIVRTQLLAPEQFDRLKRSPTRDDAALRQELGEPSFQVHLHGVGSWVRYYMPEGLRWINSGTGWRLLDDKASDPEADPSVIPPFTYADYSQKAAALWEDFAGDLLGQRLSLDQRLAEGKRSPDGGFRAILEEHGGYWGNWLIIKPEGKAEQRYNAAYFVNEFEWLDEGRLLYRSEEGGGSHFYVIDAHAQQMRPIVQGPPGIRDWGITTDGRLWLEHADGTRHELAIR